MLCLTEPCRELQKQGRVNGQVATQQFMLIYGIGSDCAKWGDELFGPAGACFGDGWAQEQTQSVKNGVSHHGQTDKDKPK